MSVSDAVGLFYVILLAASAGVLLGLSRGRRAERDAVLTEVTLGKAVIAGMDDVVLLGRCAGADVRIERTLTFRRISDGRFFKATITEATENAA